MCEWEEVEFTSLEGPIINLEVQYLRIPDCYLMCECHHIFTTLGVCELEQVVGIIL